MTFGACGLLVQSFVLRSLLAWFGEQRVLCLGIGANLVQMVVLALATAKWQAFGAIALGSLGGYMDGHPIPTNHRLGQCPGLPRWVHELYP